MVIFIFHFAGSWKSETMRRFLCYFRLLIVLKTATIIVSLDQADFSAKFEQVVDNVLGANQFKVISLFACALGIVSDIMVPLFTVATGCLESLF